MKLYLAGPMSGIPQFNYPAFAAAAEKLREQGHTVLNPAEMDDPKTRELALASMDGSLDSGVWHGESWADFLARDVKIVADSVEGVALLKGWEKSRGARLEAYVALTVQKPVYLVMEDGLWAAAPRQIMREIAHHTIVRNTDKEKRYG